MNLSQAGTTALNAGKATLNFGKNTATGAGRMAASVGTGFALPMVGGAMATNGGSWMPGGGYASKVIGFGNKLVDYNPDKYDNLTGSKVTKLGIAAFAGTAAVDGSIKAYRNFNQRRMGTVDSHVTRATPQTPTYDLNAGATGDLVFAMNANRRG